jgi:hypothetical protein
VSLFCRHNRFISDCPICSKGTVLDPDRKPEPRPRTTTVKTGRHSTRTVQQGTARTSRGPYASAGPYDNHEIRLERVPGGLRLAAWLAGGIEKRAPVVDAGDLPAMLASAVEQSLFGEREAGVLREALANGSGDGVPEGAFGASPGRSGELKDELRVERIDGDRLRIARWILRPNRGWELQEAPVLLPPGRFADALAAAGRLGVLASGQPTS